jgi:hypothetical protein
LFNRLNFPEKWKLQRFAIVKHFMWCNRRLTIPTITDRLKIIVRRGNVAKWLFGFDIKFYVAEIRREIKRIIGATLRRATGK